MLGAAPNPIQTATDQVLAEMGREMGREHHPTTVAVYFGEPGVTVPDPYFGGEGPSRTGCNSCGGCMLGCRFGAKNTLDKNYLYLAEKRGLADPGRDRGRPGSQPRAEGGYEVDALSGLLPPPASGGALHRRQRRVRRRRAGHGAAAAAS